MPDTGPKIPDADTGNWVDAYAPAPWRPYLRMMRADRPIGTWLLLLPCWQGLALAGLAATYWQWWRTRGTGWAVLAGFQLAALALALVQLRGTYAGTLLAAPGLAALIACARERGALALAGAWIASAGFFYCLLYTSPSPRD